MKHTLVLSLIFTACSLFGAHYDQYIGKPPRTTFGGTILPCTLINGEPYFLLGKESYKENDREVWSDCGGSNELFDVSAQHVALREFAEETAKTFCDDMPLNPQKTARPQLIANIKQCEKTFRLRPYINCKINSGKMAYWSVAKVPYALPSEIRANACNAQEEKYKEMIDFVWVKAYPFLNTIANVRAEHRPNSKEIIAPTIMVTNELNQQQRIAIRALFFKRVQENNQKIKTILSGYVQNPY